ncbi:MAG: CotH kinase family protein [Cyclobacteriaceae bacterium]
MQQFKLTFLILSIFLISCEKSELDEIAQTLEQQSTLDISVPDWTASTHEKLDFPGFDTVFPENQILRIDLTISEDNWNTMQEDLDNNLIIGRGPEGGADVDFTPIWVPATLTFEGLDWYQVGIRYKGNSTLRNAYQSNTDKYPFKLDFDQFESIYPAINNQRFFGFKQLNLSNNDNDDSFMREKVAADLFRAFGIPAAHTSFCEVYLNRGNGSQFLGLYTLVEEVDNTVYKNQFSTDDGNLYKPDGNSASFAYGTWNETEMDLKTGSGDYSDTRALYDHLHSDIRANGIEKWQGELEQMFNVDHFLKYLAVNNTIQNWDTYGNMTHNYFLYNDNGLLTWIPWDNNEAFAEGKMGGALSLGMQEVNDQWPLIAYIMESPSYQSSYRQHLQTFRSELFNSQAMSSRYQSHQTIIQSVAEKESGRFQSAITELINHVGDREMAVDDYIKSN